MVTRQEAFNALMARIYDKSKLAVDPQTKTCMYDRRVNGGCAIGAFIPPEKYSPDIEGKSASKVFDSWPTISEEFETPWLQTIFGSCFWNDLQCLHDDAAKGLPGEQLRDRVKSFQKTWNLSDPPAV
jgi:hypothetical protein